TPFCRDGRLRGYAAGASGDKKVAADRGRVRPRLGRSQFRAFGRSLPLGTLLLSATNAGADSKGPKDKAPPAKYTVTADTVTDATTHLIWQRTLPAKKYAWKDAGAYCQHLNLGGFTTGWRLPSTAELLGIVEKHVDAKGNPVGPQTDATAFPNTPYKGDETDTYGSFWSSSAHPVMADSYFLVSFGTGDNAGFGYITHEYWVRCVR
ncbi:MAG: DUF1566 domain-containing protein, partial [Polyangiales bacterium]